MDELTTIPYLHDWYGDDEGEEDRLLDEVFNLISIVAIWSEHHYRHWVTQDPGAFEREFLFNGFWRANLIDLELTVGFFGKNDFG